MYKSVWEHWKGVLSMPPIHCSLGCAHKKVASGLSIPFPGFFFSSSNKDLWNILVILTQHNLNPWIGQNKSHAVLALLHYTWVGLGKCTDMPWLPHATVGTWR